MNTTKHRIQRITISLVIMIFGLILLSSFSASAAPSKIGPFVSCAQSAIDDYIKESHCDALVDLYNATDGAGSWGDDGGWLITEGICGYWNGITCDGASPPNVTIIALGSNNLSGPLPDSLGDITTLQTLLINDNSITGPLPSTLGGLTNLTNIYATTNQISGSLPSWLGNLTNLKNLDLGDNQFTGIIPASLGNLTNLENLGLSNNNLSGNLPPELAGATSLQYLFVDDNVDLTWQIPMTYTGLSLGKFYYNTTDLCAPASISYNFWETDIPAVTTGQTCTPIFSDGFESGGLTSWSGTVGSDIPEDDFNTAAVCKLCVKKKGSLIDQYSLKVRVPNHKPHFVKDNTTNLESGYNVRFQIKVGKTLKMAHLNKIRVLQGRMGKKQVFFVEIRKKGAKFQVRAALRTNAGKMLKTKWYLLPKKSTTIEVNWKPGAGTGYLKLFVNGNLKQTKSGVNNDTLTVETVRLGTTKKLKPAYVISGSYKLDAFASDGTTYIGLP